LISARLASFMGCLVYIASFFITITLSGPMGATRLSVFRFFASNVVRRPLLFFAEKYQCGTAVLVANKYKLP